jgi:hypothetical protein
MINVLYRQSANVMLVLLLYNIMLSLIQLISCTFWHMLMTAVFICGFERKTRALLPSQLTFLFLQASSYMSVFPGVLPLVQFFSLSPWSSPPPTSWPPHFHLCLGLSSKPPFLYIPTTDWFAVQVVSNQIMHTGAGDILKLLTCFEF